MLCGIVHYILSSKINGMKLKYVSLSDTNVISLSTAILQKLSEGSSPASKGFLISTEKKVCLGSVPVMLEKDVISVGFMKQYLLLD